MATDAARNPALSGYGTSGLGMVTRSAVQVFHGESLVREARATRVTHMDFALDILIDGLGRHDERHDRWTARSVAKGFREQAR